ESTRFSSPFPTAQLAGPIPLLLPPMLARMWEPMLNPSRRARWSFPVTTTIQTLISLIRISSEAAGLQVRNTASEEMDDDGFNHHHPYSLASKRHSSVDSEYPCHSRPG